MSDDDWISPLIAKARGDLPLVTLPVVEKLQDLLKGLLSERELPNGKLTNIAKELIADTGPVQHEAKAQE